MAFHHLWNSGKVYERRRSNPPPHRLCGAVRYHIVALLAFGTFIDDVGLTDWRAWAFHHDLEVMDHRFHLARRLRLGRKDDTRVVDVYGADRDLKIIGLVIEIREILSHIVIDAGRAQHRT